jgi:hypothetical protein
MGSKLSLIYAAKPRSTDPGYIVSRIRHSISLVPKPILFYTGLRINRHLVFIFRFQDPLWKR